jgi:hypothetical protein
MDLRAITDLEGGRLQSGKLFGPVGPTISHQLSSLEGHSLSIQSVVGPLASDSRTSCRPWHIAPFYIRFSQSSLSSILTHERNADQLFLRQMPAVKTNHGTPACPSPGVKFPLTPLLPHRRHHRLHRLTAATTH